HFELNFLTTRARVVIISPANELAHAEPNDHQQTQKYRKATEHDDGTSTFTDLSSLQRLFINFWRCFTAVCHEHVAQKTFVGLVLSRFLWRIECDLGCQVWIVPCIFRQRVKIA